MKTAEVKASIPSQTRRSDPFFNRGGQATFFSAEKESIQPKPFFSKFSAQPFIQTKLSIGKPGDPYEQEADAMAEKVVQRLSMPEVQQKASDEKVRPITSIAPALQTKCATCEQEEILQSKEEEELPEEKFQLKPVFESNAPPPDDEIQRKCAGCVAEEKLQKKGGGGDESTASTSLESSLSSSKGSGSPMSDTTRQQMESSFGADFSKVRIHTGSKAVQMGQDLHAQAFTHGSDIYFNSGKYNPSSREGQQLLAHELTHTIQQGHSLTNVVQPSSWEEFTSDVSGVTSSAGDVLSNAGSAVVDTAVGIGEGISGAASTVSETVSAGIEAAEELGEEAIRAILERFVPGLWDLINDGIGPTLKDKILNSLVSVFQSLKDELTNGALLQKISEIFAQSKEKIREWQKSIKSSCDRMIDPVQALMEFLGALADPYILKIKEALQDVAGIAGALWNSFEKPAWEAIQDLAGDAWDWLESTAQWIWDHTETIRNAFNQAWEYIKTQLGFAEDNIASIWEEFKEITLSVWEEVKQFIQPVLGPLTAIGGVLLLFSPLGPVILIYKAAPKVWNAFKWMVENWSGWQTIMQLIKLFAVKIFPAIRDGIQLVKAKMEEAVAWVNGIIDSLKAIIKQLLDGLGVLEAIESIGEFISQVQTIVDQVKIYFDLFIETLKTDLNSIIHACGYLISEIWNCIRPVFDFVLGVYFLLINPWYWPTYAVAFLQRLAWELIPDALKVEAIDFLIDLLRASIDYLQPPNIPDAVWQVFRAGAVSFLNRLQAFKPDQKIRFVDKLLNILVDPRTYGSYMRGLVSGFVLQAWDLVYGLISLTVNMPGIIKGIINFFINLIPDLSFIKRIYGRFKEISAQIGEWLNQENFIEEVTNMILSAPEKLAEWMEEMMTKGAKEAEQAGKRFAKRIVDFILNLDNSDVGYLFGNITGRILFEVLLTKGVGFVIGKLTQGINWLRRALALLKSGAQDAARSIFVRARQLFNNLMEAIGSLFRKFGERMGGLFEEFKHLIDDFIQWVIRALKGSAENQLRWLAFKANVKGRTEGVNAGYEGKSRSEAFSMFNPILLRFNDVAGIPLAASLSISHRLVQEDENSGYWRLMARKKFGVLSPVDRTIGMEVGRLLIKRVIPGVGEGRWERGNEAVRARITEGFSPSELNKRDLDQILHHYKEAYRYRRLEVVWDEEENDWNVMASMSPVKIIGAIHNPLLITPVQKSSIIQKADTTDEEIAEINNFLVDEDAIRRARVGRRRALDNQELWNGWMDERRRMMSVVPGMNRIMYDGKNFAAIDTSFTTFSGNISDGFWRSIDQSPNERAILNLQPYQIRSMLRVQRNEVPSSIESEHAEIKMNTLMPRVPLGVTSAMCRGCQQYFMQYALENDVTLIVDDGGRDPRIFVPHPGARD